MSEPQSPNDRLAHYRVISRLGAGGMGEVYLAEDTRLSRRVALKILPAEFKHGDERVRRFELEARAASALNHPNIITIYEIGEASVGAGAGAESVHYIAAEFVDGETLRQRLRGPLKLSDALDIAVQVAAALAAAHAAGIVHRDIKPENVMVRRDGYVKVLDFGLAKLIERLADRRPAAVDSLAPTVAKVDTEPGTVMGTAHYMSPEQARGLDVDARSDTFSFGALLYEMVAGRRPFDGATTTDVILAVVDREPPPLSELAPAAPAELQRIVAKALRKDREERYQHVKDLLLDLKELRQEVEFEAKLARSGQGARRPSQAAEPDPQAELQTARLETVRTDDAAAARTASGAEYILGEIKRHKLGVIGALLALAVALTVASYFAWRTFRPQNITSVAVLPFVNEDGGEGNDYLTDGLSESLIDRLSALPGVKVIARGSSFRYRGKDVDPQAAARALGVEALVMGKVSQRDGVLQIRAELVDARDQTQVWGHHYSRALADLLAVQAEIADELAAKLRPRLSAGKRQSARRESVDPVAYQLLLKGRFLRYKGGTRNREQAVRYLKQALEIDPNLAPARAQLAATYRLLADAGALDPKEAMPMAEAEALRAVELDPNLAEAHLALANIRLNEWNWAEAEREYKRTIELNPNLSHAHSGYSYYLSLVGRHEQAIAEVRRAKELDPLSPGVSADVGYRLFFARDYAQAVGVLKQALELDRTDPAFHLFLGLAYAAQGRHKEAIAALQEAVKVGDSPSVQIYLGYAYARSGERGKAREILARLQSSQQYVSPAELAVLYAGLGEKEQALALLERAYAARDLQLQFLGVDPSFDGLHGEPRFQELLKQVGLAK
jgi:eukaryotic-like serine/threonine-protein kinase